MTEKQRKGRSRQNDPDFRVAWEEESLVERVSDWEGKVASILLLLAFRPAF